MKLFEFEAKNILKGYGIKVPQGSTAGTAAEAQLVANKIGKPLALKSQILVSGRGKAGGIVFADNETEAKNAASKLLGSTIKGCPVDCLLIEEKLDITEQFYASITVDRQARTYVALASNSGGVDIEEVAKETPEKISRDRIDFESGFKAEDALGMLSQFGMDPADAEQLAEALSILYTVVMDYDAELVELNPLVKTATGEFIAADARIIIDDSALFRHAELAEKRALRSEDTPREAEARAQGLAYVDLDGNIGVIGNGAGLVMATIDLVQHFGGSPGNFLDLGGGGQTEISKKGILLVMAKPEIDRVLINILGGITRCDVVAQAIIEALGESKIKKPITVRLTGTNERKAAQILRDAGIDSHHSMEAAIKTVVKLGSS